jgi:hypothetical protein
MEQKISIINNWTLHRLLTELQAGNIKIPRFQRDYIWEKSKVVKLLNSVYNQYPIGSLFFWKAPAKYAFFIRPFDIDGINDTKTDGDFQFILDGQQRIMSLFVALMGKKMADCDYSTICFNTDRCEFVIPRSQREKNNVPVWRIIDDKAFEETVAELEKGTKSRKAAQNLQLCREVFLNYPMSIVLTTNTEIDDVVEIFERINQGGKHLTIFDLIHATTWSEKFDLKQNIDDFNTAQRIKQFGRLGEKVFSLSLTINAFGDARSLYQLKLTPEICTKIWPKTKAALLSALDFLKQMRLQGDLTMYHNLLPTLQYYFFLSESKTIDPGHQKTLEKWFWDAKFSKRYSASAATRLKEDISWIKMLINNEI